MLIFQKILRTYEMNDPFLIYKKNNKYMGKDVETQKTLTRNFKQNDLGV